MTTLVSRVKVLSRKLNYADQPKGLSFDVVVPTLFRKSLPYTIDSIYKAIPNPNIILISDKGSTGEFRNKGLSKCTSEYCCFVDDDIILNKQWFEMCIARLESDKNLVAVRGTCKGGVTNGCLICRTKPFKELGGFPKMDVNVDYRLGSRLITLQDATCEHMNMRGFDPLLHAIHALTLDFQTENKWGVYESPTHSVKTMLSHLKDGLPDYAIVYFLWITKAFFVKVFILMDRIVP